MATMLRVNAVIQARLGSTRLPGKVLADLGGLTVLEWVVRACRSAAQIDGVVVATTTEPADDEIVALCQRLGVDVVRGSESDVLSRFIAAVDAFPCDGLVRVTADCPLLDPEVLDAVVAAWRAAPHVDYASSVLVRTLPHGLDCEVVSTDVLRRVDATATGVDRVHVTSAIWTDPETYAVMGVCYAPAANDIRVTLDTDDDLTMLRALVAELGTGVPSRRSILDAARRRPDIVRLNADVRQKALDEG